MTQTAKRVGTYLITALDLNVIGHGDTPTALGVVASVIAAEIDALTLQRDEATAKAKALTLEVERLRPAAEAWEAQEAYNAVRGQWPIPAFEVMDAAAQRFNDAMKAARADAIRRAA